MSLWRASGEGLLSSLHPKRAENPEYLAEYAAEYAVSGMTLRAMFIIHAHHALNHRNEKKHGRNS